MSVTFMARYFNYLNNMLPKSINSGCFYSIHMVVFSTGEEEEEITEAEVAAAAKEEDEAADEVEEPGTLASCLSAPIAKITAVLDNPWVLD